MKTTIIPLVTRDKELVW